MTDVRGKRVFVGLSGGVDSAVSALLLQQAGADVVGVFIKGWYPPGMPCTWSEDRADAMRAAAHLRIPFHTLDASSEYKEGVIEYLLREYAAGRTPNPDVMCNREVKFGAFYRFAMEHGADYIATGHYVQQKDGVVSRGMDAGKDQSYFLWAVPREVLANTLFPVGSMPKERTREIATTADIPQATKRDSQGVCFLGSISVDDFLRSAIGATPGPAITEAGEEIGTHEGAVLATLGERVSISGLHPGPWYVVKKDMLSNTLTVAHGPRAIDHVGSISLAETNWLQQITPTEEVLAQYRYHGPCVKGVMDAERSLFTPTEPLSEPLASGQSLVLYRGEEMLGGGIMV
jgi:tRNA-specific 2-thiouridylase